MGTIWVKELTGGLDTRRPPVTTAGGVLIRAEDGHITRGGDFEQRASFVPTYQLPAGSVGLAATGVGLVVFGHTYMPASPLPGIAYQRLQHPTNPALALARVLSYDLHAGKIYVAAEFSDGSRHHFYDGVFVAAWFDGRARASFRVAQGTGGAALTDLKVNFVSVIGAPVAWSSDVVTTANNIANAINSHVSTPNYTATVTADTVNVIADTQSDVPNGYPVDFTVTGGLIVDPSTDLRLAGGTPFAGAYQPGAYVRTIGSKMYSTSGPNLHFSGIQEPTKWTTDNVGAGFIDMSRQSSGSEELLAVAKYQSLIAVFSEYTIQIWFVDADPANNKQSQVLNNTGTISPQSVTQFGDADLFYLNETGLRSLRARDSSNAAATTDIGVPVDAILTERIQGMSAVARENIIGLIEPQAGRFWLIIGTEIFVFSFFSGAKVSAWTLYNCTDQAGNEFEVDAALTFQRRVYLRSGNTIYVYGGLGAATVYDDTQAIAQLPFLDAGEPARMKNYEGIDVACLGEWDVEVCFNPNDLTQTEPIAIVAESTFNAGRLPMQGSSTHISFLFKSKAGPAAGGPALLSSALIHFAKYADED